MSKYFPILSQTHVFIQTDDTGGGFNCKMLPVSALDELSSFSEKLAQAKEITEFNAVRDQMIALAKTVIPESYQEALQRFDVSQLAELLAYLMYGDADCQPKKAEPPKN